MASSKRPNYIVETRFATERKRRKSDLVIMWHSIWGVTSLILQELWMTLLKMWEFVQLWFSSSERFEVQTWLEKYLPYVPDDFSDSWRDGRLLAILLNKLQPGCFPDASQLDPDYGLRNVYKAFDVLEMYFGIKPNVSVEEIVTCVEGSDSKLFGILLELKLLTDSQPEDENLPEPEPKENAEEPIISQSCIAKGTGLAVGFVGRLTNFIIFCAFIPDLDVIIEIRGPNTICSERITKRSPKKKRSVSSWEYPKPLTRSISLKEEENGFRTEEDENLEQRIISLEYEIIGNQISISYRPKEKGQHKVSILWHGQHVSDSPYFVTIEDPSQITGANFVIHRKSALKTIHEGENNESRKSSVRFQESHVKYRDQTKFAGRVLGRRVLRYIVKINGKDIPVNAESTESLATELLKMEYNFETCPSSHRRNSWGFTGDAERKKSVIRQFGIDVEELEAQICLKRSRSLSISPGSRRLLEKCDAFDNITSRLNIVNEDVFESNEKIHENEGDYAYINEDLVFDENEIHSNEALEMHVSTCMERGIETFRHSKLFQDSSYQNSGKLLCDETEFGKISSLSTEATHVDNVDNSNEDLPPDISQIPEPDQSGTETTVKLPFNCEVSNRELNDNNNNNEEGNEKTDCDTSKCSETSVCKKIKKKTSKIKKYRRDKKNVHTKKVQKSEEEISYSEVPSNKNSIAVLPITISRNKRRIKKPILKTKEYISLKVLECLKHMDTVKLKNQRKQNDIDEHPMNQQCSSSEMLDTPNNFSMTDKPNRQNDSLSTEKLSAKNNDETKISHVNETFRNIVHLKESKDYDGTSKHEVREPEIKKIFINHDLNAVQPSSIQSQVKAKGVNVEQPKTIRTHTLRTIGQLNFKQFNPPVESQSSISPVKSQIVQWESTLSTENQKSPLKRTNGSEIEQVSVKEKLAFWENACKTDQNSLAQSMLENNRKINLLDNNKSCKPVEGNSNTMRNDLRNLPGTGSKSSNPVAVIEEKTETRNCINKEINVAAKKNTDDKITSELQVNAFKIRSRSFSDPGVSETAIDPTDDFLKFASLESSTNEYLNSSNDDNLEQYLSEDSEDSGGDYIQVSTEDEYIDDEISGSASEYWGDLSGVKGLKMARCSVDSAFPAEEFLWNHQLLLKSFPEECKMFGIAVYYGYVAVKNRFQVYTGDAGFGNLSVSMQGFKQHDVSLVSVAYVRKNIYEVIYQVMTTGYYLISVRWMDKEIPGSPFVCKVTF